MTWRGERIAILEQQDLGSEESSYQVIGDEGRTPFAVRLRARSPRHPGPVLVEVLAGAPAYGRALDAFRRRLLTVSFLGHPGILEADDLASLPDGTPVVISALPDGVTLARWLADGGSGGADAAVKLVEVLAGALAAAHAGAACHGSLSPEQVLLAAEDPSRPLLAPRLMGFAQRWLAAADAGGADASGAHRRHQAEDVKALARLAERVLTPAELCTSGDHRSFGTGAAVGAVIARVLAASDEQCPGALALARDLAAAVAADGCGGEEAGPPTALVRAHPPPGRRPLPRFVTGLMAGSTFGLATAMGVFVVRDSLGPRAPIPPAIEARTSQASPPKLTEPSSVPVPKPPRPPVTAEATDVRDSAPSRARATPPRRARSKRAPGPAPAATSAELRSKHARRPPLDVVWSARHGRLMSIHELDSPGESPTVAVRPPPFRLTTSN